MNHYLAILRMLEILIKKFIEHDKRGVGLQSNEVLSFSEMMLLIELSRCDRMTTQELLSFFPLERGIMSTLLNRLISQGLITKEKDEQDKRKTYYTLTAQGKICFKAIETQEIEALEFVMKDMSINEQKAILKFLSRINQLTVDKYEEESVSGQRAPQ